MPELSTRFNFQEVEKKWTRTWLENNIFHAEAQDGKDPYSIVIPPPNVTGILHMGHALNNTLQDIIIRYKRMQGHQTCWMPGTDHAGIATQNVVEKSLAKEGKSRHDLGREELLKRLWDWKQKYGDTIINQLKGLGASCDWPRTRFTMDDGYSQAVKEVFVRLYEKGLIYRGQYIINWCPRCQTALSDEEAEHQEHQGALYHIRYPLKDDKDTFVVVATTRPETMLGDTAVAVNPDDARYKDLIGKTLILPIIEREIPVIADAFVDPEFGTGAVKVTPAHDPNDFAMGQRHNLEFVNIMHPNGVLNENAGDYAGYDRFEAREAIIENLEELKLLDKVDQHSHAVGHCYRCHTVVEPYLSQQWFVKMKPLAGPAIKAVKEGRVKFIPEWWTKVYLNWMENIRDWCISRQIWWGHRIPVWYCRDCPQEDNLIVAKEPPKKCPRCQGTNLTQDEDVLDTWFSSWLWPFATFGWPQNNPDLNFFYPTNSLFTASEIIFFWVARMIMAGLEFMGDIPFTDVYIHGTVRDTQGRKMSKSLGNAIDPLEIIDTYGADALRFSLIINSGQDLYISKEKFEIGRNFANKIWNAARLVMMNTSLDTATLTQGIEELDLNALDLADQWILSKLYSCLAGVEQAIGNYRFSEAENLIYDFFWGHYCDWYLEIIKNRFAQKETQQVAFGVLATSIKMIHPFMPFVTEEIWQHLNLDAACVSVQPWPKGAPTKINKDLEAQMQILLDIVTHIRNVKTEWNIKPNQEIDCYFTARAKDKKQLIEDNAGMLQDLLKIKALKVQDDLKALPNSASGIVDLIKFFVPLGDVIDIAREKERMQTQMTQFTKAQEGLAKRLSNKSFLAKAPQDVVAKEKERLDTLKVKIQEITKTIKNLN